MTDEAEKVIKAMDAVEAITDPTERALAISQVLADQKQRNPRLKELRRKAVEDLKAEGLSLRKIAAAVGVSLGTVQDILRGHSGSWADRPKAQAKESDASDGQRADDPPGDTD